MKTETPENPSDPATSRSSDMVSRLRTLGCHISEYRLRFVMDNHKEIGELCMQAASKLESSTIVQGNPQDDYERGYNDAMNRVRLGCGLIPNA